MTVPAARGRGARRRRGARAATSAAVLLAGLLVLLLAPGHGRPDVAAPPSASPTPAATPGGSADLTMTAEPATAAPDSVVTLWFPGELLRGVAFTLESERGSGWELEYHLVAPWDGRVPGPRSWRPVGGTDGGWPDLAVAGPGGERVRIPATAGPGTHRLCTANAPEKTCTLLTIT